MRKIEITHYILPIYLVVVLLIQVKINPINVIFVCLPLLLVSVSIYLSNKKIGFLGLFLFFIFSISTIKILNFEDFFLIFIEIFFIIMPSILMLGHILQIDNKKYYFFPIEKKQFLLSSGLFFSIITIYYLFVIILWDGILLSQDNIEAQILILVAISSFFCFPLLLVRSIKEDKI